MLDTDTHKLASLPVRHTGSRKLQCSKVCILIHYTVTRLYTERWRKTHMHTLQ